MPTAGTTPATSAACHADGFLTLRGRKKDMLALPDGQKVYPEDVEAVLATRPARARRRRSSAGRRAAISRSTPCSCSTIRRRPTPIVRDANAQLGAHQQIRGFTIWPDEDFPRTHTLKVKKHVVLDRLATMAGLGASRAGVDRPVRGGRARAGEPPSTRWSC